MTVSLKLLVKGAALAAHQAINVQRLAVALKLYSVAVDCEACQAGMVTSDFH